MKLRSLLCYLLMLIPVSCIAAIRDKVSDSLRTLPIKHINKKVLSDTASINIINKLANNYIDVHSDSAIYYAQMAINNSKLINYKKGIADGLLAAATVYEAYYAKYEIAKKNLDEAILLYQAFNAAAGVSRCYLIYADIYYRTGKYDKALFYFNKALAIKVRIKDLAGLASLYTRMGNLYDDFGYPSTAIDYYFKSLGISTQLHNDNAMCGNYYNIGVLLQSMRIYPEALLYYQKALKGWSQLKSINGISLATQNIGEILLVQGKYNEAIININKSISMLSKTHYIDVISSGYNDLGLCYMYKNENKKARECFEQSLKLANGYSFDYNKATVQTSLALYYNRSFNYKKAEAYAVKAKKIADRMGSIPLRTNATIQLINALGGLGNYKDAFLAQKEFDKIKAGFKIDESVQRFTSYNLAYDFAAKQQQQLQQQKASALLYEQKIRNQRFLNIIFFVIIAAMVIILTVYYRQKRKQIKINTRLVGSNRQVLAQKIDLDNQAEKLNELNKLKDRLIAILAHDLRSPLSTLRGLFSLLEDETLSQQELLAMIPEVVKKLDYTSDFLDTLLFWVNSQMDNFNSSIQEFQLGEVINNETANYREQAASKGIKLVSNVQNDLTALADPNSLRIVVRNLVTNAIKFCSKDDSIEVSAIIQNEHILVSIVDTGMGMTEEQRNKLFKNKVESKMGTRNESGTGMGLLFCKDLVEKFNGTIWVNSELGKGTAFYFTVPMAG